MPDTLVELPKMRPFENKLGRSNGFSEHYGALQVASAYCGASRQFLPFNMVWQHGCFWPWSAVTPALLTYNAPNAKNKQVFVARKDQEDALLNNGYAHVKAVGLPMVYVGETKIARRKGSLLVVPIHSLAGMPFGSTRELDEYADMILNIVKYFSEVVVCVHPSCRENGHWFKQFSERGIETVEGARTNDANALLRMKMLFDQFEFVTTNDWGSHVAYALYCGAKVSICGAVPAIDRQSVLKDPGWGGDVKVIEKAFSEEAESEKKRFLDKFYCPPQNGVQDIETGRWLVGEDNKLSSQELRKLFECSIFERLCYYCAEGFKTVRERTSSRLRQCRHNIKKRLLSR